MNRRYLLRPSHAVLLGLGFACLCLNFGMDLWSTDYRNFYDSSKAWLHDRPAYGLGVSYRPNLNPPWFLAVIAPLTAFDLWPSYLIWTGLNLALVGVTLWQLFTRRPDVPWPLVVLAVFLTSPAWVAWHQGQVVWIVFACVTMAWLAESPIAAGLWLAPAIMLKPPLAVMALLLPWATMLTAGTVAAGATLVLVPVFGLEAWRQWLASSDAVFWIANFSNGSVWGLAARISEPTKWFVRMSDVAPVMYPVAVIVAMASAVPAFFARNKDVRWSIAFLAHLFVSPLGWSYYLPAMIAPCALAPKRRRWLVYPAILCYLPIPIWVVSERALLLLKQPGLPQLPMFAAFVCLWVSLLPKRATQRSPRAAAATARARPGNDPASTPSSGSGGS